MVEPIGAPGIGARSGDGEAELFRGAVARLGFALDRVHDRVGERVRNLRRDLAQRPRIFAEAFQQQVGRALGARPREMT